MSKAASSPATSPDEQNLPPGWASDILDNLAQFRSGSTPDKSKDVYWGGNLPWVTAKDLKRPTIGATIDHLSALGATKAPQVGAGAILLLVRGMTLHNDIPLAITSRTVSFNQDVKALVPNELAEPQFLLNYLQSIKEKLLKSVESAGHGTGRLNTEFLKSLRVPLPPLAEQLRIVATLSTWDETLDRLSRQIQRKAEVFASLREVVVHGTRRIDGFEGLWRTVTTGSFLKLHNERVGNGSDLPVYSITRVGMLPQEQHFNKRIANSDLSRHIIVRPGDLALSGLNFWLGSADVSTLEEPVCISPDYKVFKINGSAEPRYMRHVVRTARFLSLLKNAAVERASIVRKNFDRETFLASELQLPEIREQRAIIEVLDDAEREIVALGAERRSLTRQRDALATELLTGRLRVPLAEAAP